MFISENNLAALTATSNATTRKWADSGIYPSIENNGIRGFNLEDLIDIPEAMDMVKGQWNQEFHVTPLRQYNSVELFAGAGGLALGMSLAGFHHVLLNEFDTSACNTLRANRPDWNIVEGDVRNVDFSPLKGKIDFLSGGFPCQAFSYAGKQGGFNDTRGTLFFELARAVKEIQPKVFMGENVKGLISHDEGRTFDTIKNAISELGYTLVEPRVLKAIMYQVPQKRERIILIAIRNDIADLVTFIWPSPFERILTLRDALFESVIYDNDVPHSEGVLYPEKKRKVLDLVPQGGDWRDLPPAVAENYMGGSYYLGGGKTGMARRLSLDEPSLTLTCSPCQKQTERCHPFETRPLTVREYARIQTFPDYWIFKGSMGDKYKQIGNAVPVNLAWAVGRSLIRLFNEIQIARPENTEDCHAAVNEIMSQVKSHQTLEQRITKKNEEKKIKQVKYTELLIQFPEEIVNNENDDLKIINSSDQIFRDKNLLVSLVKVDNFEQFLDRSAKIYYTGKRFPATVALNKLYYFMPYLKGKGIRDLYIIKVARVGTRKEGQVDNDPNDIRLVFEVEYIKPLFSDYMPVDLPIWHTYLDTTIDTLMKKLSKSVV